MENIKENVEKLNEYLQNKVFSDLDIVKLIKYISSKYGVSCIADEGYEKLDQIINPSNKIVFILVDGLGAYKVLNLKEDSVLKSNLKYAIKTVNPTSTACILTSLFTAKYPSEHGILGWWQYSKKYNTNFYPILFEERKTGKKLSEKDIDVNDIFKFDSIFDKYDVKANIYINRQIVNSEFTKKSSGNKANRYGIYSIRDGFKKISNKLKVERKSFNYLYISEFDEVSHSFGIDSKEVLDVLLEIENGIKEISKNNKDVTVIVTSDHGQVEMSKMIYLNQNHDYTKYFYAPPSMDTRMISFFVKPEYMEEFRENFLKEFREHLVLLTKEQAYDLNIFGGYEFSTNIEDSLGEYIAVIVNNNYMVCDKLSYEDRMGTKGNHSGLTKEETTIPLIVIKS